MGSIWSASSGAYYAYGGRGSSPEVDTAYMANLEGLNSSRNHNLRYLGRFDVGGEWMAYEWKTQGVLTLPALRKQSGSKWAGGQFGMPLSRFDVGRDGSAASALHLAHMLTNARSQGPTAIANCAPTEAAFDAATAVGEVVLDAFPAAAGTHMWREATAQAKSLRKLGKASGSEYLNYEFGWKPLVRDILDFSRTVIRADEILSQYTRESGSRQRRRFTFPKETGDTSTSSTESHAGANWAFPTSTGTFSSGQTVGRKTLTVSRALWFTGAFKYHIPDQGMGRFVSEARKLLGVVPTPETIWNLAPWTWAGDWFGNTGDCLANLTNLGTDSCVMEWGYVMQSEKSTQTISVDIPLNSVYAAKYGASRAPFTARCTKKYLVRATGHPFYWSVSPADLSTKQKAIVAALGLSQL